MAQLEDGVEPLIMNPDCQTRSFMAYMRAKIPLIQAYEMQNEEEGPWQLDLCDESGHLRNLPEKLPLDNLGRLFERRTTYIPILITKNADGYFKNLVPLVEEVTLEMDKRLKKHLRVRKGQRGNEDTKSGSITSRGSKKYDRLEHTRRDISSTSATDFRKDKKTKSALSRGKI